MARYFGLRPETTYGIEDTSKTIKYLEVNKCTLQPPSGANLDIETIEETPTRTKRGFYSPSGDVEIALDIPTIIDFLYYTFGVKVDSGTAAEGLMYEMYPNASKKLPSFTCYAGIDDGNTDDYEYVVYGCCVSKLVISLSDGIAIATITIQGQRDSKATLKTDSEIDIDDTYPIAFYEAKTYIGDENTSSRSTSLEFSFDNKITATNGQAFDYMHPYRLPSSGKEPTVKTTVFYNGSDILTKYWGSEQGPTCNTTYETYKVIFEDEKDNKLTLFFPKFSFDNAPATLEGSEEIKQDLEFKVLKGKTALADDTNIRTSVLATVELAGTGETESEP